MKITLLIILLNIFQYFGIIFKNNNNQIRWFDRSYQIDTSEGKKIKRNFYFNYEYRGIVYYDYIYDIDVEKILNNGLKNNTTYISTANIHFIKINDTIYQKHRNIIVYKYDTAEWNRLINYFKTNELN